MNITVGQEFFDAVQYATRICGKSVVAESDFITVSAHDSSVTVETTNPTQTIKLTLPAYSAGYGKVTVNAQKFWRILSGIEQSVTLTTTDGTLVIETDKSTWSLPRLNSDVQTLAVEYSDGVEFNGSTFIHALLKAKTVVSNDPARWAYQQVVIRGGYLFASDGVQYLKYKLDPATPDMDIPSAAISDFLHIGDVVKSGTGMIRYVKLDAENCFSIGKLSYTIMSSGHDFPVSDQVFQHAQLMATSDNSVAVHAAELYDGVYAVSKVSPKQIMLAAKNAEMYVTAKGDDSSSAVADVAVHGEITESSAVVAFDPISKFIKKSNDSFTLSIFKAGTDGPTPLRLATDEIQYLLFQAQPLQSVEA